MVDIYKNFNIINRLNRFKNTYLNRFKFKSRLYLYKIIKKLLI